MECVVGPVVKIDAAAHVRIANGSQGDTHHGFEVRQHASQQMFCPAVGPAGDDRMSEEIHNLSSFAIWSRPLAWRSSALSLHQLTPGSLLNQVRCRRA